MSNALPEVCERHGRIRCDECAYIDYLQKIVVARMENSEEWQERAEHYRKALEKIKTFDPKLEYDDGRFWHYVPSKFEEIRDIARNGLDV